MIKSLISFCAHKSVLYKIYGNIAALCRVKKEIYILRHKRLALCQKIIIDDVLDVLGFHISMLNKMHCHPINDF